MATDSAIAGRIRTALADYLKRDPKMIGQDYSLRDDLGLDSMQMIELLYRIEEAFDFQIPDEDLQKLVTVADVIGYVEGRLRPSSPSRPAKRSGKRLPAKKKG